MPWYLLIILCLITSWLNGPPILYLIYIILSWVLNKFEDKGNEEDDTKK